MSEIICENCGISYTTNANTVPYFECICKSKNFTLKQKNDTTL